MDWSLLLAFVAILFAGGIFLLAFLSLILSAFTKILDAKIAPIKEDLSNHITDTTKKIEAMEKEMKEGQARLAEGQAKLEAKLDRILADKKA